MASLRCLAFAWLSLSRSVLLLSPPPLLVFVEAFHLPNPNPSRTMSLTKTTDASSTLTNASSLPSPQRSRTSRFRIRATAPSEKGDSSSSSSSSSRSTIENVVDAALLIAGVTVGGGFLALPTVVAPNGFVPSATALVAVCIYLGAQSWIVVECLCRAHEHRDDDDVGPATPARVAFGAVGERLTNFLLVVLVEATLVSQISRAGAMFPSSLYRLGCVLTALALAVPVFGSDVLVERRARRKQRRDEKDEDEDEEDNEEDDVRAATFLNSVLTTVFGVAAVSLFVAGTPAADFSRLTAHSNWASLPKAIPTFLQLLVYGEVLPTVCRLLNYRRGPIRWAVGVGSFLPLVLEVGWAALGVGLSPLSSSSSFLTEKDPVDLLLSVAAGGPAVRVSLVCLAVAAVFTTILAEYLALRSVANDVARRRRQRRGRSSHDLVVSAAWCVLPATAIASVSPSLFLGAIDFAGSYPVLILFGLLPPAVLFRLQRRPSSRSRTTASALCSAAVAANDDNGAPPVPESWLALSFVASLCLVGTSAVPDAASLWSFLSRRP